MNLIYKDNNFKILIDFYKKPAVIELYENYNEKTDKKISRKR